MRIPALALSITLIAGSASAHGDHVNGWHTGLSHLVSHPLTLTLVGVIMVLAYGASRRSGGFRR